MPYNSRVKFSNSFIQYIPRTTPHTHLIVDSPAPLQSPKSLLLHHRSRVCGFFDQASVALREVLGPPLLAPPSPFFCYYQFAYLQTTPRSIDFQVQAVALNHHVPQVLLSGSFDHTVVMKDGRIPSHTRFKWSVSADVETVAWDPHTEHSFVVCVYTVSILSYFHFLFSKYAKHKGFHFELGRHREWQYTNYVYRYQ
ncbi:uncharacterized protein LOC114261485 [Camellia sinensis]|uniref:uncharacterized protein LOC114261485 n=1 Tax=Camellia sinensis TaxID=4442 RepID=UPI001035FDEF|nr:uncharacterized protein LOC114261485 [Camellia sinensis]